MKKKYVVLSIITLVLLIAFVTSFNYFKTSNNYVEDSVNNQTKITKGISMNLEQTAGAGDYKQVTQSNWPGDDYAFNAELSKCENGSTLSWDNTKNVVVFSGNVSDKCYVYFDKYVLPVINDVTVEVAYKSVHVKVDASEGSNKIEGYYYYLGQRPVQLNGNNEYTYTNLTLGNHPISIIIRVRDTKGKFSIAYEKKITLSDLTLINYVKSQYTGTQGENNIYYHDSSLANGAGDNSYRYAGANPNNFVCFGSDASPCPTDNLYRIVGVFGDNYHGVTGKQLVKLIKYDYATSSLLGTDGDYGGSSTPNADSYKGSLTTINTYSWNNVTKKNTWSESNLNKINLNTNFINNIGSTWANKIATVTWKVGGNTYANIRDAVPSTAYQNEVVNPVTTNSTDNATTYSAKVGLMYASDYGFGAVPEAWTTKLYSYDGSVNGATIRTQNWMHMGFSEWTILRRSDYSGSAFNVHDDGIVSSNGVSYITGVRPSFNLLSSTTYVSGSGSVSDPVRIN